MMETKKDLKNNLLKRRELDLVIESNANPGFAEVTKSIAKQFNSPEENVVIKRLKGNYGRNSFAVSAFIYSSVADKDSTEPKIKVKKAPGAK